MFWSSFSIILPDGFELLRLYSGLSGPLFFVFLSQAGHLLGTRTPQSDVRSMHKYIFFCGSRPPIRYDRECFFSLFFPRAFITPRSQFHVYHRSQRVLTEIVSKITPNLGLVLRTSDIFLRTSPKFRTSPRFGVIRTSPRFGVIFDTISVKAR